ncbi:MAG: ABC transporter ATP-binding protein [candidate division KSB1 bacterium]|nr:ABC transporter ATP-binding protein [candidate division KSB1 bacterium]
MAEKDEFILSARGIHKYYPTGRDQRLHVLKGIDLAVRRGEIVSIVGPSGVGKSTLLHILGALDRPTSGTVYLDGVNVFRMDDHRLAAFRNRTAGFVFQFHHLLPEFTALENVMMPALIAGVEAKEARRRAEALLVEVGLADRMHHRPNELSGGEQQRVAVARALTNRPRILLADEPSGNLDAQSSRALHELLWRLVAEHGLTLVIVTHNMELAKSADRLLEMYDGRICREQQLVR